MSTAFAKALDATATTEKKSKARKKTTPILDNAPADIKDAVDHYVEHKKLMKEHKAEMDAAGDAIIDYAETERDKDGFAGNFSKSYDVHGNKEEVKFVTSNRFSVNADDEELLTELLGVGKFAELFETLFNVELRDEVLKDEALQKELMDLIGDKFSKFFTTHKTLRVAADFDSKIYLLDEDDVNSLRSIVKQYKPSLR